ncbi:hypothetical protein [Calothrix sp. PCC 6303]|uniref:hypothetical protein n=1 Tax=Calothrix sp. PCC 6303 TaxID=1170562 RepID=UPI0002A0334C|nr:hypothetical protein [Calothrix sp. PCC 6303]AFZ00148.1 hypothetical protein Cal6303_1085 [Calothrix sp. PCC 6303]
MPVIRLILLVTILGGLTLLLAYNWSPVLPLKFFGMATQGLPLAMWILFSTAAGAATTVFISGLFGFSNYFGRKTQQNKVKSASASQRTQTSREEEPTGSYGNSSTRGENKDKLRDSTSERVSDRVNQKLDNEYEDDDDWDMNRNTDDWEFDSEEETPPQNRKQRVRDTDNYQPQRQPKNTPQSNSTYSYSYQEPKGSSVGKTESIYDADYRVIIPPYPSSPEEAPTKLQDESEDNENQDDDWGLFDEDDDFEDEDKPSDGDSSRVSRQNNNRK